MPLGHSSLCRDYKCCYPPVSFLAKMLCTRLFVAILIIDTLSTYHFSFWCEIWFSKCNNHDNVFLKSLIIMWYVMFSLSDPWIWIGLIATRFTAKEDSRFPTIREYWSTVLISGKTLCQEAVARMVTSTQGPFTSLVVQTQSYTADDLFVYFYFSRYRRYRPQYYSHVRCLSYLFYSLWCSALITILSNSSALPSSR